MFGVFEYEYARLVEQSARHDNVGQGVGLFEVVRGVGEYDVELVARKTHEVEGVAEYGFYGGKLHLGGRLGYERVVQPFRLHRYDAGGTARGELVRDGSGA